jgi:hypothetical protein
MITVDGWVKDTDADGQCAQVSAYFEASNETKFSARACPKGTVKNFHLTDPGSRVNVYLSEVGA